MQRQPRALVAPCAVRQAEQFKALESAFPRIPMLPAPFCDETLSSWLHRCAIAHGLSTAREFAASVLETESQRLPTGYVDFDTNPPPVLIAALVKRSRFSEEELQRMIVSPTGNVLHSAGRDAYCPCCFQEDVKQRAVYMRGQWLNPWILTCANHRCVLGHYTGLATSPLRPPELLMRDEQVRLGTEALGTVVTVDVCGRRPNAKWLNSALLEQPVFRKLFLLAGSIEGEFLYSAVFGQRNAFCWKSDDNRLLSWNDVTSPDAPILARLRAAYVASVVWPSVRNSDRVPHSAHDWLKILFQRSAQWNTLAMPKPLTLSRIRAPGTALPSSTERVLAAWEDTATGRLHGLPLSDCTKEARMQLLRQLAKFLNGNGTKLLDATTADICSFLVSLNKRRFGGRRSARSTNHLLRVLDHFYDDVKVQGLGRNNPIKALRTGGRRFPNAVAKDKGTAAAQYLVIDIGPRSALDALRRVLTR